MSTLRRMLDEGWCEIASLLSEPEASAHVEIEDGLLCFSTASGAQLAQVLPGRPVDAPMLGQVARIAAVVPADRVIKRIVELPAAARDLEQAARYSLAQWSPYPVEDTLFTVETGASSSERSGFVSAELRLCSTEDVREVREALDSGGLVDTDARPNVAAVEDALVASWPVRSSLQPRRSRLARSLWVVTAAVAAAILVTPFLWLDRARADVAEELALLRPLAESVQADRAREQRAAEALSAIAAGTRRRVDWPAVLEGLAKTLPEHTYLESIEGKGERFIVRGVSPIAAQIPERVEAVGPFFDARLSAPLLRVDAAGRRDRFEVTASLAKRADAS